MPDNTVLVSLTSLVALSPISVSVYHLGPEGAVIILGSKFAVPLQAVQRVYSLKKAQRRYASVPILRQLFDIAVP